MAVVAFLKTMWRRMRDVLPLLVLLAVAKFEVAFGFSSVPKRAIVPRRRMIHLEGSDSGDDNEPSDSKALQRELNAMMMGKSDGSAVEEEDIEGLELYNAAPLFTGVVVTIFTLALTGYGIYAGLTGDDPLTGHPKL